MADLGRRFVAAADSHADQIEARLLSGDLDGVRELAHGLAGRSGMFGFQALGEAARNVDEATTSEVFERAQKLLAVLRNLA